MGFHRVWQKGCKNSGVPGLWHSVEESCPEVQSMAAPWGPSHPLGPFQQLSKTNAYRNQNLSSNSCFLGKFWPLSMQWLRKPDILGQATRANGLGDSLENGLVPCEPKRLELHLPSARAEFSQSLGSENRLTLKSSKLDTFQPGKKGFFFLKTGQNLSPLQQHRTQLWRLWLL